jgi:hypothetical protein
MTTESPGIKLTDYIFGYNITTHLYLAFPEYRSKKPKSWEKIKINIFALLWGAGGNLR